MGSCRDFREGVASGSVGSKQIDEASGIAASRRNPGVFFIHNDSGDSAQLYAIDLRGRSLGRFSLPGVQAIDWEDIAAGPASDTPGHFLYVGDFGDNSRGRKRLTIYRVREPRVELAESAEHDPVPIDDVIALEFRYPKDKRYDAEALWVDPLTSDLYIVSKTHRKKTKVFRYAAPHRPGEQVTVVEVASFKLGRGLSPHARRVTAADLSPDGKMLLFRTYADALLWERNDGESLEKTLESSPCRIQTRDEPQGEAIAWTAEGDAFLTVSEGEQPSLHYFAKHPDRK